MDIAWLGQACFKLKGKQAAVVIDPFDPEFVGLKLPKDLSADVVLSSHSHQDHNNLSSVAGEPMQFSGPGEYEVKGVVITGISSYHDNSQGSERGLNTIFNVYMDGLNIVHLGDLGQDSLTEEQVAQIGEVDILLIPVGGVYTINGKIASYIVSQLEPKIVIPMHYKQSLPADAGKIEDLEGVEPFLKEMGTEGITGEAKLTITQEKLPEESQVVLLAKPS